MWLQLAWALNMHWWLLNSWPKNHWNLGLGSGWRVWIYERQLTNIISQFCLQRSADRDCLKNRFGYWLGFMIRDQGVPKETTMFQSTEESNRVMFFALFIQRWLGRCDECMVTTPWVSWCQHHLTTTFDKYPICRWCFDFCKAWGRTSVHAASFVRRVSQSRIGIEFFKNESFHHGEEKYWMLWSLSTMNLLMWWQTVVATNTWE